MLIAIHQPHFIPWLGYLHRMSQVEAFVLLDHVQYEKANYQNRTQIRVDGEARWLTVPLIQRSHDERIIDKEVDNRLAPKRKWGRVHFETLRRAYAGAPYFKTWLEPLRNLFEARWERLADLDRAMLDFLREAFDIRTPVIRSSELGVDGAKAELVLNICRAVGADQLLIGFGGSRGYLDPEHFAAHGIEIRRHEFEHPVYPQRGDAPFIPGLAAIDLLLNCGPQSREILLKQAVHEPCAVA